MGRGFQVAQLDVCREHFLSRCEWVLRKIPQSKYADLFRRTQFFTLKIMFRSYWSFWAIVRENWLNLWFLRNKTNVNRKLAIKPEGGRNLKKWVYRSCVWRRGSGVRSFKKLCRKIVQLLDWGLQRAPRGEGIPLYYERYSSLKLLWVSHSTLNNQKWLSMAVGCRVKRINLPKWTFLEFFSRNYS